MYIVKNHFLMKTYSEAVISNTVYHKFPTFIVTTAASPNKISYIVKIEFIKERIIAM